MRTLTSPYFAWAALIGALFAWLGVGYFVWAIASEKAVRSELELSTEQAVVQQSAAIRLRTVARETKEARQKLDKVASVDVVEMLDLVEEVARASKIPLKINQALSEAPTDPSSRLHAAAFAIEAEGSFQEIMHVLALLEALPVPSSLTDVQFERLPSGSSKRPAWRVVSQVRFFTSTDIAS